MFEMALGAHGHALGVEGMMLEQRKSKLRRRLLQKLKAQPTELRRRKSGIILNKLASLAEFKKSRTIMFFVSTPEEVDTMPLLREVLRDPSRSVTVPRIERKTQSLRPVQIYDPDRDLVSGTYGILEPRPDLAGPFDAGRLDVVLVPGIAFDRKGHRLGRGKCYYDRFLKTLPHHVKRYGLAFDFQLFEAIPSSDLDVSVDYVITNE